MSNTKMINGWEKGKKEQERERKREREREREREQKEDDNECGEFFNKPASLQQRRVRAANWHEAVVAVIRFHEPCGLCVEREIWIRYFTRVPRQTTSLVSANLIHFPTLERQTEDETPLSKTEDRLTDQSHSHQRYARHAEMKHLQPSTLCNWHQRSPVADPRFE